MDELAFLTLMLLINHRIPHVPLEFYECRFWLEMKGNHTLFGQGANTDQSDITMQALHGLEGPPEKKSNITEAQTSTIDKWAQRIAQMKKEKVGGPRGMVG